MGKLSQPKNGSCLPTDKTNPSFKWARMLHLLDYHRWNYVKKILVHKKQSEGPNCTEGDSIVPIACDLRPNALEDMSKSNPIENTTESSVSARSSQLPSSPRTKSTRAARIRKMIAKEVTKRRGRHRRSSTCPEVTQVQTNDSIHQGETSDERVVAELIKTNKLSSNSVDHDKKCDLCNTMHIECQLGDKKQIGEQGDHQLDHIKSLLQEIPDEAITQLSFDKNITRSTSAVQHSKEFLDAMDVLSMNKQFFLRILDDPGSSLRNHFLAQQAASSSSMAKSLEKSGTFPIHHPSNTMVNSPLSFKRKQKSHISKENNDSNKSCTEKPNTSQDTRLVGKRFKDLRHKLKHAIKESRKERRRIAMDAVLHKVPYGYKVSEESNNKGSPSFSTYDSEFSFSPFSNKEGNNRNRRSSSFDECLDRYCQLFETTSFSREANKSKTPDGSGLRVMHENPSRTVERGLGRIFSSPDLHMFLSHRFENCDGHRMPNREIMSFNEKRLKQGVSKEDLEDGMNNDEITIKDPSNNDMEPPLSSLEVTSCEDYRITTTQPTPTLTTEPITSLIPKSDDHTDLTGVEEIMVQDPESLQPQDMSDESPTFACTKVDDDEIHISSQPISPTLHHVHVTGKNEPEFNYVRDILQLSGYTGTQLLGTWYSSDQPVDPSVFTELENCSLLEPQCSPCKEGTRSSHLLLFDLINEILLAIYERSMSYWYAPLSSCSRTHPMPKGYRVLEEVWACINWYMGCSRPELDSSLDYITTRDLAKDDRWMNLQFDAECVGLEVEKLIFEDLLIEFIS